MMHVLISGGMIKEEKREAYFAAFLTLLRRLRDGYKPIGRFSFSLRGWRVRMTCGLLERLEEPVEVFVLSPCRSFVELAKLAADAIGIEIHASEMRASTMRSRVSELLVDVDYLILLEPEDRLKEDGVKRGVGRVLLREAKKRGIDYAIVPIP